MRHGPILLILAIMLLPSAITTSVAAMEVVKYQLTPAMIKDVRLQDGSKGIISVYIQLTEAEKDKFTLLTQKNIGNELHVVYSGQTLVRATVRAPIDSGIIHISEGNSKQEAIDLIDSLNFLTNINL